ncbi:unnamed protein product [Moneuplotes crassus]|uniref:Uncharacterized protein n=1 Tax=Euplotes crassus TaxID=5936 RepID=A0AAD1XRG5_EUPCR|nr:unnamed protein product [Moneuplotes crassus]
MSSDQQQARDEEFFLTQQEKLFRHNVIESLSDGKKYVPIYFEKFNITVYFTGKNGLGLIYSEYFGSKKSVYKDISKNNGAIVSPDEIYDFAPFCETFEIKSYSTNSDFFVFQSRIKCLEINNKSDILTSNRTFYNKFIYKSLSMVTCTFTLSYTTLTPRDLCRILICGRHLSLLIFNSCRIPDQHYSKRCLSYHSDPNPYPKTYLRFITCQTLPHNTPEEYFNFIHTFMEKVIKSDLKKKLKACEFDGLTLIRKYMRLAKLLGFKDIGMRNVPRNCLIFDFDSQE